MQYHLDTSDTGVCLVYDVSFYQFKLLSQIVPPCEHVENKKEYAYCPTCGVKNGERFEIPAFKHDYGKPLTYRTTDIAGCVFPPVIGTLQFGRHNVCRTFGGGRLFILLKTVHIPEHAHAGNFTTPSGRGYVEFELSDRDVLCGRLRDTFDEVGMVWDESCVKIVVFPQ